MSSWLWSWEWFPANLCVWILSVIVLLGGIWLIITIIKEIIDELIGQLWMGYIMIDLDKDIELYKSKVAFYESQNTRGEYAVTVRELKFVVETLEALRAERSQGDLISRSDLKIEVSKQIAYCDDKSKHQSDLDEVLRYANTAYGLRLAQICIDNAPGVESFTQKEKEEIADAINYLLGAELLEENGYTEEVKNALRSALKKVGGQEE